MSRSNPTETSPNPCHKWLEWSGKNGNIKYYDKESKTNVSVPFPFTFVLLDVLSCIKGWHDATESGIFSNEVRDTRAETFIVKSFGGQEIAEGFYKSISDRVKASGGHFSGSIYLAFKDEGRLIMGNLQLKGAALFAWSDFQKANQAAIYKKAITITGSTEGKKGSVTYQAPTFGLIDLLPETNEEATKLDEKFQQYLSGYFKRTRSEQVAQPPATHTPEEQNPDREQPEDLEAALGPKGNAGIGTPEDPDIPFSPNHI